MENSKIQLPGDWLKHLASEFEKPYMIKLKAKILEEKKLGKKIFPPGPLIFNAFHLTHLKDLRVVILGQDPYHGYGQAHGLCFSVKPGIKPPPSLVNIYKELASDIDGFEIPNHGYLQSWAEQGVLMLNTVLTVEQGKAHSHAKSGWEIFTDSVIDQLNQNKRHLVFILWGRKAQEKGAKIDRDRHLVLTSAHPSPLSAHYGFFGSAPFSKTNNYLCQHGITPINWDVTAND